MNIKAFKASYPNVGFIQNFLDFFSKVADDYNNLKSNGYFINASSKAIYIYKIERGTTHYALITSTDFNDLIDGKILGHENTLVEKEEEMIRLLALRKAMIKPVLLTYPDQEPIDEFIHECTKNTTPILTFNIDEIDERHTLWAIDDKKEVTEIKTLFKNHVPISYIADGHHRAAVSIRLKQENQLSKSGFLCAYLPFSNVQVYDYNRILLLDETITEYEFMSRLTEVFHIKPIDNQEKPNKKHDLAMYFQKNWYRLQWKADLLLSFHQKNIHLDVSIFNEVVLENILGIKNIKDTTQISYIPGIDSQDSFMEQCNKNDQSVGFCLFPISISEIVATADAGEILPPKSTWFEPRMKNGIVNQSL